MQTAIYFDATLLASYPASNSASAIENYLDNLLCYSELVFGNWADVFTSIRTVEILEASGTYPSFPQIKAVCDSMREKTFSFRDVVALITAMINKTPFIETELKLTAILHEHFKATPSSAIHRSTSQFMAATEELLTLVGLHIQVSSSLNNPIYLTPHSSTYHGQVSINSTIVELQPELDSRPAINIPCNVNCSISFSANIDSLNGHLNPCSIINGKKSQTAFEKALIIYGLSPLQQAGTNWEALRSYSFHSKFIQSCNEINFFSNPPLTENLLRACLEVIQKTHTAKTHQLKEGDKGSNPPIMRGRDGAWRRKIDQFYRLHYWETQAGPEFACVVPHDIYTIPS